MSAAQLTEYTRDMGFNYVKHSFICSPLLSSGLVSTLMWDWQHCYFVNGIFDGEVEALLLALGRTKCGLGFEALHQYLQLWVWPKGYASGATVCKKLTELKGTASEYLSFAPVLARWLENVAGPSSMCSRQVHSALLLCGVVDSLALSQRSLLKPSDLELAVGGHLHAHQEAYGEELWVPKAHFTTHLPDLLQLHGCLLSCFTHERKHKTVKRMAYNRVNTRRFDVGVLEEVLQQHLYELQSPLDKRGLAEPRTAPAKMTTAVRAARAVQGDAEVTTSRRAWVHGRAICVGDVAMVRMPDGSMTPGTVWFHCQAEGDLYACMSPWVVLGASGRSMRCRINEEAPRLIPHRDLLESLIYSRGSPLYTYRFQIGVAISISDVGLTCKQPGSHKPAPSNFPQDEMETPQCSCLRICGERIG